MHLPTNHSVNGAGGAKLIAIVGFVALLGLAGFLYAERQKNRAELQALRAQAQEVEALRQDRAELEQLRGQMEQLDRLKADNQELVKLRGEVATLRPLSQQAQRLQTENQQLRTTVQQLQKGATESATLRSQNEKLQGVLVERDRAAQSAACVANLRAIEAAKAAWVVDHKKARTDVPGEADLFGPSRYLAQRPVCPANGLYTIGSVQEKPTCNMPGHAY